MSGTPVAIGPFSGGLNNNEDPSYIGDDELVECINFDVGRSGELTSRVGVKALRTNTNPVVPGNSNPVTVVGVLGKPNGAGSRLFAQVLRTDGTGYYNLYYSDNPESSSASWTLAGSNNGEFKGMVSSLNANVAGGVFDDFYAWFIPYGGGSVGYVQSLSSNVWTEVSAIPRGHGAVVFKNRLFVYGDRSLGDRTYRVYYSSVGNFSQWPANNFFDVEPGDGDYVQAMAIQGDSLIIFKSRSTWVLYFETDPFLGTLRKINNDIGATGPNSVMAYENELYVISERGVYRLVSLLYEDIGQNLNLPKIRKHFSINDFIVSIGDKFLIHIDTGDSFYPHRYYTYHTQARAWSEYVFPFYPNRVIYFPDNAFPLHQFITAFNIRHLYHMHPRDSTTSNYADAGTGTIAVRLLTKRYTYDSMTTLKRLFWWALEVIGNTSTVRMSCVIDGKPTAEVTNQAPPNYPTLVKGFIRTRFRNIQYKLASTGSFLLIRTGEARVDLKKEVDSGYPKGA